MGGYLHEAGTQRIPDRQQRMILRGGLYRKISGSHGRHKYGEESGVDRRTERENRSLVASSLFFSHLNACLGGVYYERETQFLYNGISLSTAWEQATGRFYMHFSNSQNFIITLPSVARFLNKVFSKFSDIVKIFGHYFLWNISSKRI